MAGYSSLILLLLLAACLSLSWAVFLGSSLRDEKGTRQLVKRYNKSSPFRLSPALKGRLSESKPFTYPSAFLGVRERRSDVVDKGKCGLPKSSVLETDPVSLAETAEAIQAVWIENDNILIVASDNRGTTIWLGIPRSIGIFSFTPHPDLIKDVVAPSSLKVAPTNHRRAIVISEDRRSMFVTSDGGERWIRVSLPSRDFDESEDIHFSSVSADHLVLVAGTELYYTRSAGEKWTKVADDVKLVRIAKYNSRKEYAFYLTRGWRPGLNVLHRLDLVSGDNEVIDSHTYRFAVDGHYLFVSRQNFTGNIIADNATRRLYVCSDFGASVSDVRFSEVELPSVMPEQFYVIMATHEAGAFIHVSLERQKTAGGLYVSDSSGTRFSLSLSNHFYKVYYIEAIRWRYSIDDFYEVNSMRGVYITTAVTEPGSRRASSVSTHVTMITFNNGGEWSRLRPPDSTPNCRYPSCSLHLHLHYSHVVAHLYNLSYSTGLLSVKTAVGIIIGHGSIGESRNDSQPRLVLSNNGGYSWNDPGLPVGTYVYGIADYGNIIAVAPDDEHVQYIWFSHDRGKCFVKQLLDTTTAFSMGRGLLMDPRAASLTAFVMGVEGDDKNDEWRMITLNFKGLLQRKCMSSDYVKWVEHGAAKTCLLGYKYTYNLTKSSSICYNEDGYNYRPIGHERCNCSYDDLECDYGYKRISLNTCEKMKNYDPSKNCPPGAEYLNKTKSGFRLIPGDRCQVTGTGKQELNYERVPCKEHEEESGYDDSSSSVRRAGASAGKIVGGIIIGLVIIAVAVVAFYGFLRCREHIPATYEQVLYKKLPTTDMATEESDSDEDLITPSDSNPFEDT